ncbi:12088_t:CDS:2 [Acaulospora morrowiae]|uniref:ADP-ribose 1''-phosphate phosphatase n=1 Tax=Acaulospora morrowiae TaxID=94023 RepID=A0A9N9GJC2_9GLOM|nr:12088_t:CDS:2 [Acaulospora morrowiae]
MPYKEVKGDLFKNSDQTDALAHCVSQDLRMGKGIAKEFKKRYNGISELKSQKKEVGQVAYLSRDNRYIFYLITKSSVYEKPTEEDFEKSLVELRRSCEEFGVKGLSVPSLGTGLDKLSLEFVRDAINRVFAESDIRVTMYRLEL